MSGYLGSLLGIFTKLQLGNADCGSLRSVSSINLFVFSLVLLGPKIPSLQGVSRNRKKCKLAHLPFTSEAAGSNLTKYFLNATRTQSSCEKSKSQRSAESRGFSPGTQVSSHRES